MSLTTARAALIAAVLTALPAAADQRFPATLAGHAMLPAMTLIQPPADAPDLLKTSGKFTAPDKRRVDALAAVAGTSFLSDPEAPRATGLSLPFPGQPLQGFSGIKSVRDGTYWTLIDNGFGSKANSADAILMMHRIRPDWNSGRVTILQSIFLHDPDRIVPFPIVNEGTAKRYLTGADFDPESFQPIGDTIWIGDEFGPYLLQVDRGGRVLGFWETTVDGKPVRSPDHYAVSTPATPGAVSFNARRSRGYEGMAASPDGRFLYPLLEGPLWDEQAQAWETDGGKEYLRILEFDVALGRWSGRHWKYRLEINGNNIGDFNMVDATTGLIIERDNGEGPAALACQGGARPDCFNVPARFKRVYKIEMSDANAGGFARKIGHIDLLDIADPRGKARQGGGDGKFAFPFVTIENVDVVDGEHIIVANDNNLPYSSGRQIGKQDDNEFILLRVPELLRAR